MDADELVVDDGDLLWGDFGKNQHHQGENPGHGTDICVTEQADGDLSCQRAGGNVHEVVADQDVDNSRSGRALSEATNRPRRP